MGNGKISLLNLVKNAIAGVFGHAWWRNLTDVLADLLESGLVKRQNLGVPGIC